MEKVKRVNFNMDNDLFIQMKIKAMEERETFTALLINLMQKHCAIPVADKDWSDLTPEQQEQRAEDAQKFADSLDRA